MILVDAYVYIHVYIYGTYMAMFGYSFHYL